MIIEYLAVAACFLAFLGYKAHENNEERKQEIRQNELKFLEKHDDR